MVYPANNVRLELIPSRECFAAALVLGLPIDVVARVEALRSTLAYASPPEYHYAPHLTVLYLGRMMGGRLLELQRALGDLRPCAVHVRLRGIGTFGRGGTVGNIHVPVAEAEVLRRLHEQAREVCLRAGWTPQTAYVGARYTPHVSLVDHVRIPEGELNLHPLATAFDEIVELHDPHLLLRHLDMPG